MAKQQQGAYGKGNRGWDNNEFNREQREHRSSRPQEGPPVRSPYDPSKELVVGEVGRVPLDTHGRSHLVVEYISYNNGPRRVRMRKIGTDRSNTPYETRNPGTLWPDQCVALARLLTTAANELSANQTTGVET